MKKYIIVLLLSLFAVSSANAYEIGEFVHTNEFYQKCFGKCSYGYIVVINCPKGNPTNVVTLNTGEDLSTYWLAQNESHKSKSTVEHIDLPDIKSNPHLSIACPCGAMLVIYEWIDETSLRRIDKFMELHLCAHKRQE